MSRPSPGRASKPARVLLAVLACAALVCAPARALDLVVQPDPERDPGAARALAARLSEALGRPVRLVEHDTVLAHWRAVRAGDGAARLVVDEAHFTDYRVERLGYRVLAGLEGTDSFALVTAPETLVLAPEELAGRRIAAPAPPSLGAARLLELVPGGLRAPVLVDTANARAAVARVARGEASAALVPDSAVPGFPEMRVVLLTEATPAMALSASPAVDDETAEAVTRAVLEPPRPGPPPPPGLSAFRPASAALYAGYARLLRGTWDY